MLLNKIEELILNNFDWIKAKDICLESNLKDDLGFDSISLVELQILIEEKFNIRFNPIETDLSEVFKTIASLQEYLEKNIEK
jgi:acyl carrier protein